MKNFRTLYVAPQASEGKKRQEVASAKLAATHRGTSDRASGQESGGENYCDRSKWPTLDPVLCIIQHLFRGMAASPDLPVCHPHAILDGTRNLVPDPGSFAKDISRHCRGFLHAG